ncbi:MAG: hypothetical protein ACOC6Q_01115 [Patescibacteria group bacterium]
MDKKAVYISLGVLAVVGIFLTAVLLRRVLRFEQEAAKVERETELSPVVEEESSPSALLGDDEEEATPSGKQGTPSVPQSTPSGE